MSTVLTERPDISSTVQSYLKQQHKLLINGKWIDSESGETFPVIDPSTEEEITRAAAGNSADVDKAVRAARAAFEDGPWSRMTPSERGKLVWRLADKLEEHTDEFGELESIDNGKPCAVASAADVPLAVDLFRYMAGWATKIEGTTIPISVPYMPDAQFHSYTVREPIGVVGQIIPWNFPLLMAAWKLGPALATGCTVVLKPAEETPLTALRLAELVQEVGFPDGVVNVVTGYGEAAGAPIAAHPGVDKVAFTGSTEVGKLIVRAAGETNLKKVTLELGGKSPNILLDDADLEAAIPAAASAIFFNHGQCCCAGSRLFAHKSIYEKVVDGVAEAASKIKLGPGLNPETEMGPLVSDIQLNRVCGFLDSGKDQGATARTGGARAGSKGYYVAPTILTDTKPDMKVIREEIFGPVVAAIPFEDPAEIVDTANDTPYGLAGAVWTRDISKAHKLARKIKAGTVWINCYNVFDASLPFGGYKESGWGREMGPYAIDLYTEVKAITAQL